MSKFKEQYEKREKTYKPKGAMNCRKCADERHEVVATELVHVHGNLACFKCVVCGAVEEVGITRFEVQEFRGNANFSYTDDKRNNWPVFGD